jgi:uncharacterized protein (DUF433 family)
MNILTKELEKYFDFLSPDDIRLKGHRIGIDNILEYYLDGFTSQEIQLEFPSLTLEQIEATILYYKSNKKEIEAYLTRLKEWQESRYQAWLKHPSPVIQRLRKLQAQQH